MDNGQWTIMGNSPVRGDVGKADKGVCRLCQEAADSNYNRREATTETFNFQLSTFN
jgi:hypothetical protein